MLCGEIARSMLRKGRAGSSTGFAIGNEPTKGHMVIEAEVSEARESKFSQLFAHEDDLFLKGKIGGREE